MGVVSPFLLLLYQIPLPSENLQQRKVHLHAGVYHLSRSAFR